MRARVPLAGRARVALHGPRMPFAAPLVLPRGPDQQRFTLLTVVGVTTLSTMAMVAYPLIAERLGLDPRDAAVFLGGSIHDVAQVAGAGFTMSPEIGESAVLVKLMRVALLVPAVVLFAQIFRAKTSDDGAGGAAARPPLLPGFLVGFVALVAANSVGIVPADVAFVEVTLPCRNVVTATDRESPYEIEAGS